VTIYDSPAEAPVRASLCHRNDGLFCDDNTMKCVALTATGLGCVSRLQCVIGAYCDDATDKCTLRKAIGATCDAGAFAEDECVSGSFCQEPSNQCTALGAGGATCAQDDQCQSNNCASGKCVAPAEDIRLLLICGRP
jgi:hypothetical protein